MPCNTTMSSEASKIGVQPASKSREDIDAFRNFVNPDCMGFDGQELPADLSCYEDKEGE